MPKKKQPQSKLTTTTLPLGGLQMGNGGGVLDTTTLPPPRLEPWSGWPSLQQEPTK